jgi:stage V sporulation protein B
LADSTKQSYIRGAAILAVTAVIVKIISALFRIPLYNIIDNETIGHFQVTYNIYTLLLAVSSAGIPVALSRLVSSAAATGKNRLVKRYFSVSLPAFVLFGAILMVLVFVYADQLAAFMKDTDTAVGIRVLAPAVFFSCVIAVYRGYIQGHGNMIPTAVSQFIEVLCKTVFGIAIAWYLVSNGFQSSIASAGAITGVTIGLALAIPVLIIFKRKTDKAAFRLSPDHTHAVESRRSVLYQVFKVSIPVTLSSAFIGLITNIDTKIVLQRLMSGAGFSDSDAHSLYGIYAKGLSLLILSSALIVPITTSIIPAIAAALSSKRYRGAKEIMESSLKMTNIIAMPAGIGIMVLSYPIFVVVWGADAIGPGLLSTFGVASYFVCMQLMTTAILQATGHEKLTIVSYLIGGVLQIALDWYLVGQPDINIAGSPFGTLLCYSSITVINLIFVSLRVKDKPRLGMIFVKPALCAAVMGVAAWAIYELLYKIGVTALGSGRLALLIYLLGAIIIAVIVYGILIVATKTITRDDLKLIPRGERLANFLKIK